MTNALLESACAWVAFVAILLGFAAGYTRNFKTRSLPYNAKSPVLAMELLRSPDDVSKIVGAPGEPDNNRADMVRLMKIDFAFIPTYALVFVLIGSLLFLRGGYWRWAGILVGLLGCSAAVFDVWENIRILGVLEGARETPRCVSLIKWTLIFVLLPGAACAYLEQGTTLLRRAVGFLAAGLSWSASLFGIAGVVSGVDPLIEWGIKLMSVGLFAGWFYFATHAVLADGLLPALNRLRRWISRLTN